MKESKSGWNALIAIGRRGRIPGYLAYGRRAKWIPVESAIRSPPTDLVQSGLHRCSLLTSVRKEWSLCAL